MSPHHSCTCHDDCGCECACHEHGQFHRRFQSRSEQIDELQSYLHDLESEVMAVKEKLADLQSRS